MSSQRGHVPDNNPALTGNRETTRAPAAVQAGSRVKEGSMQLDEFIQALRAEFARRMSRKISWGRNDVLSEFTDAISSVLADALTRRSQP